MIVAPGGIAAMCKLIELPPILCTLEQWPGCFNAQVEKDLGSCIQLAPNLRSTSHEDELTPGAVDGLTDAFAAAI